MDCIGIAVVVVKVQVGWCWVLLVYCVLCGGIEIGKLFKCKVAAVFGI